MDNVFFAILFVMVFQKNISFILTLEEASFQKIGLILILRIDFFSKISLHVVRFREFGHFTPTLKILIKKYKKVLQCLGILL